MNTNRCLATNPIKAIFPVDRRFFIGVEKRCRHCLHKMKFGEKSTLPGDPGETPDTVRESLEVADSLDLEMVKVTIGIRIYPGTEPGFHGRRMGKIAPDDTLLFPKFYIENDMEAWMRQSVGEWVKDRSNWIH